MHAGFAVVGPTGTQLVWHIIHVCVAVHMQLLQELLIHSCWPTVDVVAGLRFDWSAAWTDHPVHRQL